MLKLKVLPNNALLIIFSAFVFFFINITASNATLPVISARVIADSEEDPPRRIYSYDIQVDVHDNVHIIYSKPSLGDKADIYYVRRINGVWQNQQLISPDGHVNNKSTFLLVDKNNLIHICYTKFRSGSPAAGLYYNTINDGVPGAEKLIYDGQWWGKMQLGDNGYPIFIHSDINWQTDNSSKLVMHTSVDGVTWDSSDLDLPSSPTYTFLMADFIYADGVYHITYGDSAYKKNVWKNKYMNLKEDHTFHALHYATSRDNGANWTHHVVDDSITLRDSEFWTSMVLDNGRPLIGMFKYAEYKNLFATGTSGQLSTWNGSDWDPKIITNKIYEDANEGMGIGIVVNGPGDYFGAWDCSPRYPQLLPPSPAGNTAMRRSGDNGKWENIAQLDAFSLEGSPKLRINDGKLYFLGLGDYTDTKLNFREFSIAKISEVLPTSPPRPPGDVKSIVPVNLLLMKK